MTEAQHRGDAPHWLTGAELGMWQAFRNGSAYDLRTLNPVLDDPLSTRAWGPERTRPGPGRRAAAARRAARRWPGGSRR